MAYLNIKRKWQSQPTQVVPIDRDGLGKGVQILFNPAAGPVDLVTGRVWAPNGDAKVLGTQYGKAFNFDGDGDFYSYTGYPELTGNVHTFFMWLPRVGISDDFGHVYFVDSTATVFFQVNQLSEVWVGGSLSTGSLPTWYNTNNRSIVITTNGTAAGTKCYVDGLDSGLTWSSAPNSWVSGDKSLRLGNYSGGVTWDVDASMLSVGYANRAWSAAEAKAVYESKGNALYKTVSRKLWIVSSGVSGSLAVTNANDTLSASGTTTVTGSLAKTNANDTSSASGTTTVTGSLAKTNADDTVSASGAVGSDVTGAVNVTNANDTLAASGTTTVTGSLSRQNANDTSAATGTTTVIGSLAVTNANDSVSASGAAGSVSGTVDYTNRNDSVAASGEVGANLSQGGDDFPGIVIEKKRKKTLAEQPNLHLQSIIDKAAREVLPRPILKLTKELPVKEPVLVPAPLDFNSPEAVAAEAEKVAALLAQYQEQVKRREMEEDEELLILIMGAF